MAQRALTFCSSLPVFLYCNGNTSCVKGAELFLSCITSTLIVTRLSPEAVHNYV